MSNAITRNASWLKYLITIAIFVATIGFIGENCIVERVKHKREIRDLNARIIEQQERFERDSVTLQRLKSDPEEVRRVARERYFMKQENEDVFIVEDE